jgi:hypothetical protein
MASPLATSGEVHERDGVNRLEMIADDAPVAHLGAHVARAKLHDAGADGAGVGNRASEDEAEQPAARPATGSAYAITRAVGHRRV